MTQATSNILQELLVKKKEERQCFSMKAMAIQNTVISPTDACKIRTQRNDPLTQATPGHPIISLSSSYSIHFFDSRLHLCWFVSQFRHIFLHHLVVSTSTTQQSLSKSRLFRDEKWLCAHKEITAIV